MLIARISIQNFELKINTARALRAASGDEAWLCQAIECNDFSLIWVACQEPKILDGKAVRFRLETKRACPEQVEAPRKGRGGPNWWVVQHPRMTWGKK